MLALTHCLFKEYYVITLILLGGNTVNSSSTKTNRQDIANKVSFTTLIVNIILAIIKFIAGILGKSSAMIADSIHTLSDILSTIAVIIGLHFSSKPADKNHPYGHEKIESVVAKMLALMLFITGLGIGKSAIDTIISGAYLNSSPKAIALVAAAISIISKEWMYHYTIRVAKKINSAALTADAWHHRSDVLSSIGTLVGVGGSILGYRILDPIAAVIVSIMIIKVSIQIYITGFNQLVDASAPDETIADITGVINEISGVIRIDEIKTRMHGSYLYVDTEISVDGSLSVNEGHEIAENVHLKIEEKIDGVKHCMVHINPYHPTASTEEE